MNWLVVVKKVKFKITYFALLHFNLCVNTLFHNGMAGTVIGCRGQLNCDGTRAETRFRLSAKWTGPFKSAGASVQSATGSRGVRISSSNAGCTMFQGTVKGTGHPLHFPDSPSLSPPVRHHVPSHFNWSLPDYFLQYLE